MPLVAPMHSFLEPGERPSGRYSCYHTKKIDYHLNLTASKSHQEEDTHVCQNEKMTSREEGIMAASLITGKRISTTIFDVSEPSEITTQGHKLQGPVSILQATHKNGEYKSSGPNYHVVIEPFLQKPRASAVQNDSIVLVLSGDINKAIKARARKGRTSSL